jgi:hypothetical protein
MGLLPTSDDFQDDEESVAFFNDLDDDDLVGAPRSYSAVDLGKYCITLHLF